MNCPRCGEAMLERIVKEAPVHRCDGCQGTWVSSSSLAGMVPATEAGWSVVSEIDRVMDGDHVVTSRLRCPACSETNLGFVRVRKTQLDICPDCQGVFFDRGEVARLLRKEGKSIKERVERRWRDSTARDARAAENGSLFLISVLAASAIDS